MLLENEIMKQLEEIFKKYDFSKRKSTPEIEIELVESYFNIKLPKDYRFYLENYIEFENFINVEYLKLWPFEDLVENNKSYEIQKYLPYIVAIGSNGAGEMIGIEFQENQPNSVILTPFILEEENNVKIGTNFTDFLIRLDQGKCWFDSNSI